MTHKADAPDNRALDHLAARLLQELKPAHAESIGAQLPRAHFDAASFIALYRAAIETLEYRVASGDGRPPMRAAEVALLCRCALSCGTLEEAIQCAAEFCTLLHPRAGVLELLRRGDSVLFKMDSLRRNPSPASCLVDITGLYSYLQLFSWLIGAALTPRAVMLGYPRHQDAAPFVGLFNAPVYAGGLCYGFEFDAALLERPVLRKPHELAQFLDDFPYGVVGATPLAPPLRDQVRACLDAALARGKPLPEAEALAALLGAGAATLRRRLRAEGTSYRALREQCVREMAEHYLCDTDWDVELIAARLGFSDGGAFRRAFRRWRGFAPSALRKAAAAPRAATPAQ
jgi:AraC-like DNA-binding protein